MTVTVTNDNHPMPGARPGDDGRRAGDTAGRAGRPDHAPQVPAGRYTSTAGLARALDGRPGVDYRAMRREADLRLGDDRADDPAAGPPFRGVTPVRPGGPETDH